MRNYLFLLSSLILTLFLSGCLSFWAPTSQTPPPLAGTVSVTGTVQDSRSGLALWSGTVTIGGQSVEIKDGRFQISNVTPGAYTLKISRPFYQTLEKKVNIPNSNITLTDLKLIPVFNAYELELLARLVRSEAEGEIYEGKVAVAASVLNRLLHPDYPQTMHAVIHEVVVVNGIQYYQYEPVLNRTINYPANQESRDAVSDALAGWDPSLGATGFYAPRLVSSGYVTTRPVTIDIGNHRFIK